MAFWRLFDNVVESTTSTGTGALTVSGAIAGSQALGAKLSVGDTFVARIWDVDANGNSDGDFEISTCVYSASNTVTRAEVHESSNAGALVNFGAGTKYVAIVNSAYSTMTHGKAKALAFGAFTP